ncbi:mucin-2-like isoform X2 [Asterias rubens]|uniref:mucin-2-like isoform X2 n=1 Tax=Asterias rubens TaxID=7604 RepID=UPI00145532ED|nr:mucin-2-like isoform X2 [Asterias rubens]
MGNFSTPTQVSETATPMGNFSTPTRVSETATPMDNFSTPTQVSETATPMGNFSTPTQVSETATPMGNFSTPTRVSETATPMDNFSTPTQVSETATPMGNFSTPTRVSETATPMDNFSTPTQVSETATPMGNFSTPTQVSEIATTDVTSKTTMFQDPTTAQMSESTEVITDVTKVSFTTTTEPIENSTELGNSTIFLTEIVEDGTTEKPDTSTVISKTTNTPYISIVTPTETLENATTEQPDTSTVISHTTYTQFSTLETPTETSDNFTTEQTDTTTSIPNTTNTSFSSPVTPTEQPDNSTFESNTTTPFSSPVTPTGQTENSTSISNTTPFSSPVTPTETFNNVTTVPPDNTTFTPNTTNTPSINFTTPELETSTTDQKVTVTFSTVNGTEMTTDIRSEQTTRLSSSAPPQETTTYGPTETPNVPSDRPPIFKNNPEKTILIELAISEESTLCRPEMDSSSTQCEELIIKYKAGVEALYSRIDGFLRVDILQLSKGSVIIRQNAVYNFTAMTPEDQSLTGQQVFDLTVAQAVTDGELGNLTVVECTNCNPPEDISDFCSLINQATCDDIFLEPQCVNGYVICRSPCKGTPDYCNQRGVCSQASNAEPVCQCTDNAEAWISGGRCEVFVSKIWVLVGVCFGAGFLIIVVAVVLYLCCRRCQNRNLTGARKKSFLTGDDFDGEVYMLNSHALDDSLVPGRSGPSNHVTAFSGGLDGPASTFGRQDEGENEYIDIIDERRPQPRITSYCQDVPVVKLCMDDNSQATPGVSDAAVVEEDIGEPPTPQAMENIYF